MIMHKILHYFSYITLTLTTALILLLAFYSYWPYKVIEVKNNPFPVLNENKIVKAGTFLKHEVDYCKYIDIPSETSKQFINGLIYTAPTTITNNAVGCNKIIFSTLVPVELPPGKYYLKVTKTYKVNPIRDIIEEHQTEQFTVIK